jgi:hypothetical protein
MYKAVIVMIAMLMLSCAERNSNPGSSGTAHENHEEAMHRSTLFSDSVEFFIEYPVLVRNETAVCTIHVTRLSNYKPLSAGKITVEMQDYPVPATESEIPGIYMASLKPEHAGKVAVRISLLTGEHTEQVSDSVMVFENDEEAGEQATATDPSGVVLTKEQAWASDFMVQEITVRPFATVIPASGEILAMPGEKQFVSASSAGIVLFAARNLVQGSRVNRGQLLFTISGKDITGDNVGLKISESRNRYLQSKSEYERHSKLYWEGLLSDKQFYDTQRRYRTDSAAWMTLSASAGSDGLKVIAPLTGYLHELNVWASMFRQAACWPQFPPMRFCCFAPMFRSSILLCCT